MPESRKKRSEDFLSERGIKINPHLPLIESEEEVKMKTPEELVKRALAAFLTAMIGIDANHGELMESIKFFKPISKAYGLENEFTNDEKIFWTADKLFAKKPSHQQIVNIVWRMEMSAVIFRSCGLIDELPYPSEDGVFQPEDITPILSKCKGLGDLMSYVKMRSLSEILDDADLIYRMDWACVEGRINGDDSAGNLNGEIVLERHKGFNWLIGSYGADDWDNVIADT